MRTTASQQPVKTKLFVVQIPHSATKAPLHRRVTRQSALTDVQNRPLLLKTLRATAGSKTPMRTAASSSR